MWISINANLVNVVIEAYSAYLFQEYWDIRVDPQESHDNDREVHDVVTLGSPTDSLLG